jgi:hypothetical protein
MQRFRPTLAGVILSLMLCHAAALTGSSLVEVANASAPGCQCCCKGGAQMLTCPMAHGRSSDGCRLRCGSRPQLELAVGLPGVPLPTVVSSVSVTSEELSHSARYDLFEVILPVPDHPPRSTVSPR